MKTSRFLLSLSLSLLVPTVALLPGCSGGGSGGNGTPTIPSNFDTTFALPNNKTGKLSFDIDGLTINGQLVVSGGLVAGGIAKASTKAIKPSQIDGGDFDLPNGTYPISGTYKPLRDYSIKATIPAPTGEIVITGRIPLPGSDGSYTLRQVSTGKKFSGTLPRLGN